MTAYYPDQNQPPDFLLFSPSAVSNEPGVILGGSHVRSAGDRLGSSDGIKQLCLVTTNRRGHFDLATSGRALDLVGCPVVGLKTRRFGDANIGAVVRRGG